MKSVSDNILIPELLSPAGNYEKLVSAIRFGADAVYLAGQDFGMRSAADNFSLEELQKAIEYAHDLGKKVYLTVNTLPRWNEIEPLEEYLRALSAFTQKPDALIIADLGVFSIAKKLLPDVAIHISTQAGAVSYADVNVWHEMGAERVVLARELSLDDIKNIRERVSPEVELEAFVHGSMCVSFSGRCLLSNHFTGRDANRGQCTQPCRWNYHIYEIEEEKRPDERLPIVETDRGTFIMSSKDMCMIKHIPELARAGISSFKIEGRMKSSYYAAVTANAYRMAIDAYKKGLEYDEAWQRELDSVSHRDYCTGYYFDEPMEKAQVCDENGMKNGYIREKSYSAIILSYNKETQLAYCRQRNKLCAGETAEVISPGMTGRPFTVCELYDSEMNSIDAVPHPQMEFYEKIPFEVSEGDIIRK